MDIKVKGSRLKNLFSYDWAKILISIIAGVVVWSLLFTTLGTRSTVGEEFYFTLYDNVKSVSATKNGTLLEKLKKDKVLSYDVLSLNADEAIVITGVPFIYSGIHIVVDAPLYPLMVISVETL